MRLRTPVSGARHEDILELEPLLRRVVGARVRDLDTVDDLVQEALARVIAVRGAAGRRGGRPLRHRHRPQPGHLPGQGGGAEPAPPAAAGRPERARASRGRRSAPGGGGRGRDRPGRAARPRAGGGGGPRDRGGRHSHPGRGQAVDPGRSRGPAGQDAGPAPPRLPAGLAPRRAPDRALRPVLLALPTGAGSSPWTPAATSCSARPARR
jgi:hypothetical protein